MEQRELLARQCNDGGVLLVRLVLVKNGEDRVNSTSNGADRVSDKPASVGDVRDGTVSDDHQVVRQASQRLSDSTPHSQAKALRGRNSLDMLMLTCPDAGIGACIIDLPLHSLARTPQVCRTP